MTWKLNKRSYNGTHPYCHAPWSGQHSKKACCCSCAGGAWGSPCDACPLQGTKEFDELCPGNSISYSRSLKSQSEKFSLYHWKICLDSFNFYENNSLSLFVPNIFMFSYPTWNISDIKTLKNQGWVSILHFLWNYRTIRWIISKSSL